MKLEIKSVVFEGFPFCRYERITRPFPLSVRERTISTLNEKKRERGEGEARGEKKLDRAT